MGKVRILLVDDDQVNLDLYALLLGSEFDLLMLSTAEAAIEALAGHDAVPVLVTDLHLPGQSGVELVQRVGQRWPETTCIMITADVSQAAAVDAVNSGRVFRFLNKPVSRQLLVRAVRDGLEDYQRRMSEKELLSSTVNGCISLLGEVLALVSPVAFAKTSRVTRMVEQICRRLEVSDAWELHMAATLSQLGCITLPDELITQATHAPRLSPRDADLWRNHPRLGRDLISRIPRMDRVADIVQRQQCAYVPTRYDTIQERRDLPWRGACLRAALEYDAAVEFYDQPDHALYTLEQSDPPHPRDVLDAIAHIVQLHRHREHRLLRLHEIRAGMVLLENLVDQDGRVLLTSGQHIADWHIQRIYHLGYGSTVREPIRVLDKPDSDSETSLEPTESLLPTALVR